MLAKLIMRIQFLDERGSTYTVFGQYLGLVSCGPQRTVF